MNVNLRGAWTGLWAKINTGDFSQVLTLITWVGVALLAFALVKWAWNKRKGSAQGSEVLYSAIIGAVFSAPNFLIPLVLGIFDAVANTVIKMLA